MRLPALAAAAVFAACSVPALATPAVAAEPLICVYDGGLGVGPYTVVPPTTVCLL